MANYQQPGHWTWCHSKLQNAQIVDPHRDRRNKTGSSETPSLHIAIYFKKKNSWFSSFCWHLTAKDRCLSMQEVVEGLWEDSCYLILTFLWKLASTHRINNSIKSELEANLQNRYLMSRVSYTIIQESAPCPERRLQNALPWNFDTWTTRLQIQACKLLTCWDFVKIDTHL